MGISLQQSVAVSFTGGLAFGLYFATLLVCLRWLLSAGDERIFKQNIRWGIVIATFLIFASNVVYLSMNLHGTMLTAKHVSTNPPGTPFHGPSWISIVACTAANCNVLLADIVLIHRCWIIYEKRSHIVAFPLFLWLGALVCTVLQIYLQSAHIKNQNIGPYSWASVNMTFGPGIVLLPFWISTVILNAYASGVLVLRIYKTAESIRHHSSSTRKHLRLLVRAIAESGLLYLSVTLAHLLIWFGQSELAINIIGVLNAPIVGIGFNWFLIRLERNKAKIVAEELDGSCALTTIQFNSKVSQRLIVDTTFSNASTGTTVQTT